MDTRHPSEAEWRQSMDSIVGKAGFEGILLTTYLLLNWIFNCCASLHKRNNVIFALFST